MSTPNRRIKISPFRYFLLRLIGLGYLKETAEDCQKKNGQLNYQLSQFEEEYERLKRDCNEDGIVEKKAAAFTLENAYDGVDGTGVPFSGNEFSDISSLIGLFAHNHQKYQNEIKDILEGTLQNKTLYEPLGWLVEIDSANVPAAPVKILVPTLVKIYNAGVAENLGALLYSADHSFFDPNFEPAIGPTYNQQLIEINNSTPYFNTIEFSPGKSTSHLQYYDPETKMVFFSSQQLLLIKTIIDFSNADDIFTAQFSGYKLHTGRMCMDRNMQQLNEFHDPGDAYASSKDWSKWFSLKLELKKTSATEDSSALNSSNSSITDTTIPSDEIDTTTPSDETDTTTGCQIYKEGGIPLTFFGHPCPPTWTTIGNIMEYVDPINYASFDPEEIAHAICEAIQEELDSIGGISPERGGT